jgi:hypothetical protein
MLCRPSFPHLVIIERSPSMLSIFRAITDRVKALFATTAALELEAEFLTRDAERRAELLRQAERYDAEGLHEVANHLREQAELLTAQRPLASILPALTHLQADPTAKDNPAPTVASGALPAPDAPSSRPSLPSPKKKGRPS